MLVVYALQKYEAVQDYQRVIRFITSCKARGDAELETFAVGCGGHQLYNNILCIGFGHEKADQNAIEELQKRMEIYATKPDEEWGSEADHLQAPIQVGPERLSEKSLAALTRLTRQDDLTLPLFQVHVKEKVDPCQLSPLEEQLRAMGVNVGVNSNVEFSDLDLSELNHNM